MYAPGFSACNEEQALTSFSLKVWFASAVDCKKPIKGPKLQRFLAAFPLALLLELGLHSELGLSSKCKSLIGLRVKGQKDH